MIFTLKTFHSQQILAPMSAIFVLSEGREEEPMSLLIIEVSEEGIQKVRIPVTDNQAQQKRAQALYSKLLPSITLLGEMAKTAETPQKPS